MTIYEATKEYLEYRKAKKFAAATYIQNESNLRQFAIYMRNCDITAVTEKDVLSYFALLEDQMGTHPNSIIPKSAALRGFFKYWNGHRQDILNYLFIPMPRQTHEFPRITTK